MKLRASFKTLREIVTVCVGFFSWFSKTLMNNLEGLAAAFFCRVRGAFSFAPFDLV